MALKLTKTVSPRNGQWHFLLANRELFLWLAFCVSDRLQMSAFKKSALSEETGFRFGMGISTMLGFLESFSQGTRSRNRQNKIIFQFHASNNLLIRFAYNFLAARMSLLPQKKPGMLADLASWRAKVYPVYSVSGCRILPGAIKVLRKFCLLNIVGYKFCKLQAFSLLPAFFFCGQPTCIQTNYSKQTHWQMGSHSGSSISAI